MARTHFLGDLHFIPADIQGWQNFTDILNIPDRDVVLMRRGIDSTLIGTNKFAFYHELKLPPCLVLLYFDVLSFNRNYRAELNALKTALILKMTHPVFGDVNITISLSTGFKKGCVITKMKNNASSRGY
jgi:hypothetical protein